MAGRQARQDDDKMAEESSRGGVYSDKDRQRDRQTGKEGGRNQTDETRTLQK